MSRERKLEETLTAQGRAIFAGEPEGPHLSDERLAVEPLPQLTSDELAHLSTCVECRTVVAQRVRTTGAAEVVPLSRFRRRIVPVLALAASIAAAVVLIPRATDLRSKGENGALAAEVTLIATGADGTRRDVRSGDKLATTERFGFKYGNPKGRYSTLTILGWDGKDVRWYYPERAGLPAQAIEKGDVIGSRLPFDIALSDHRAGPLKIVAAFDKDPARLAELLAKGEIPKGEAVGVFDLVIQEAK